MLKEGRSLHILGKNHEVGRRQGYSDGGKDSAAFTLVYSVSSSKAVMMTIQLEIKPMNLQHTSFWIPLSNSVGPEARKKE